MESGGDYAMEKDEWKQEPEERREHDLNMLKENKKEKITGKKGGNSIFLKWYS